jgi:uncharacterized membrane protein
MQKQFALETLRRNVSTHRNVVAIICVLLLAVVTLIARDSAPAAAQSGGGYDLTWNTTDGGGTFATGGNYSLGGTIGQADAGALAGGGYTLIGGFWGATNTGGNVYLPVIVR